MDRGDGRDSIGSNGRAQAPSRRLGRLGLRARLGLIAVLVAAPLVAASIVRLVSDREQARADAVAETGRLAALVADATQTYIDGVGQALIAIASTPSVRDLDREVCSTYLHDILARFPGFATFGAADASGALVCSAVEPDGPVDLADRSYFRMAMAGADLAIGEYSVGRVTGQPVIVIAVPLRDPATDPGGIVFASLPVSSFAGLVGDIGLPDGASVTIVDRAGTILVREPDPADWVGRSIPAGRLTRILEAPTAPTVDTGVDGVVRLYAYRTVSTGDVPGLFVSVGFEEAQLSAAADASFAVGMGLVVAGLGIALVLTFGGTRALILGPVRALSGAADRIASGDLEARTGISGGGELGELAASFDRMAGSVQGRVEDRTADLSATLTRLRESETALANQAAVLATQAAVLEAATDGLFIFDAETLRFTYVNQGAVEQVGYDRDALLAMTPLDIKPRFDEASFRALLTPLLDGTTPVHRFETVHRHRDGHEIPVEIVLQAVRLADGPARLVAVVRDITDRHRAEQRIREYLDIASDPLFIHRAIRDDTGAVVDFEIVTFTEPARALYGPEIARVGRRLSASEADTLEQRRTAYLRTLETGEPTTFRTRRRVPGTDAWRDISVRVTRVDDGVAVSARDITDELVNERRIVEYLDIAVDPLIVSRAVRDPETAEIRDFEVVFANEPARDIIGPAVAGIGNRLSALRPDLAEERIRSYAGIVESGTALEYESAFPNATTGELRDLSIRATRVGDGVAVAFRDITSTKTLVRALESARREADRARAAADSARAEADRANRSKTEFLSRMSHELRTPLNAIIGFAQLLEFEDLDQEQRDSVTHILVGGRHLLQLINEVLDISRIESGTLTISPEPVHLAEAVTEAVALIAPIAEGRGIRIVVEDGDRFVLADRQRLKQVLLNLLSNAVKFNRMDGTIHVAITEAGPDRVRVAVRDEGGGIPPGMHDRVFAPFDRLEADTSGVEGTGLGLPLSKALVERMGGAIGFESVPGEGATFWIELIRTSQTPGAETPGAETAMEPVAAPRGRETSGTILYIEDNLSNLQLVERLFGLRGQVRLIPAMLGRLGLDLAREHRPDLILLDMHLPDLGGMEVLQRLLADAVTRDIPVVILSADATPSQQERLLAQGAVAYVAKPIDVSGFLLLIDRLLAAGGAPAIQADRTSPDEPTG